MGYYPPAPIFSGGGNPPRFFLADDDPLAQSDPSLPVSDKAGVLAPRPGFQAEHRTSGCTIMYAAHIGVGGQGQNTTTFLRGG